MYSAKKSAGGLLPMTDVICYTFCFTLLAVGCLLAGVSFTLIWVRDELHFTTSGMFTENALRLRKSAHTLLNMRTFHAAYIACITVAVVGFLLTAFL